MKNGLKVVWIVFFVLIGVAVIMLGSKFKSPLKKVETAEFAAKAKVISVPKLKLKINAIGYGHVKATDHWDAVAEVAGRVVFLSDKLKDGEFVSKGDELLVIDPSSYQLALSQVEAQIETSKIKDETTRLSVKTRKQELDLLENEFQRQQKLAKKGNVSQSTLDTTQRNLLSAKGNLQTLQNNLLINRAEREVLLVQLEQTRQDLTRTRLIAPMDARITEVKISESQYANRGQHLFSVDGIESADIESQFPIGKLRPLVSSSKSTTITGNESGSGNWVPGVKGLPALVSVQHGNHKISWDAIISRVSATIDPQTQSLGIVATVDKPYEQAASARRPPLISDMFVQVELLGQNNNKFTVIPSSALHEGKVYVMNDEKRLEFRQVKTGFYQDGYVVINKGLKPKEKIVTSDLVPAIEGMLLQPMKDSKTMQQLFMDAMGEIPEGFKKKMAEEKAARADGKQQ
ncbi:MAG: efflux RND transporter periplasmic adaptor subunit [Gammaproteobacteria bacterium]|nr:efflux RND transporter periplasmic adaptor subunit [Gammaproteobacteria bacterium]